MTERKERAPVLCTRVGYDLRPLDGVAAADLERFPAGAVLEARITQPRSVPQNRLYWALLQRIVDNVDAPITRENLHEWIKDRLGYTKMVPLGRTTIRAEGSIAFDKMTAPEFRQFFDRAKALLVEHVIPGVGSAALERAAAELLGEREAA